ncbi:MAG: hypothetical protein ACJAZO_003362 [Myxococcota bacterium]|jgi:hypothetical protein
MVTMQHGIAKLRGPLVPNVGNSVEFGIDATVSIDGIVAGTTPTGTAEHTQDGYKISGSAAVNVGIGTATKSICITGKLGVTGCGTARWKRWTSST